MLRLEGVEHDDPVAIPQLPRGETRRCCEPAVVVVEADPQSARELRTDSCLPRAHQPEQSDVAAERLCRVGGRSALIDGRLLRRAIQICTSD